MLTRALNKILIDGSNNCLNYLFESVMKDRSNLRGPETAPGATRLQLIEAAGEVFAEMGFQNATVREICRRAGANVAAVNYHFQSKEALLDAVAGRIVSKGRDGDGLGSRGNDRGLPAHMVSAAGHQKAGQSYPQSRLCPPLPCGRASDPRR